MSETAVDFQNVTKTYNLYERPAHQLMDNIGLGWTIPVTSRPRAFPAIDNVSLTLRRGERVGLIGRNGAGKTTLLKLLIGHIKPTSGTVKADGSIQAMMKSDLGFHMHFTGRQNILSALTYNGLWGEQARAALADIEEFTELGAYMDQPFSSYSLGMQARLLFAVGSAVNPDILIVDEILGAGDSYFIAKSAKRMERLIDNGCTLMLVSHNTQQVLQFCDRAVWLRSGKVFDDGPARDVANAYDVYIERETTRRHGGLAASDQADQRGQMDASNARDEFKTRLADGKLVYRWPGHPGLKVESIDFRVDGKPSHNAQTGGNADIHFRLNVEETGEYQCRYLLTVWSHDGWRIARIENDIDVFTAQAGSTHNITIDLSPLSLGEGRYTLNLSVYNIEGGSTAGGRLTRYDVLAHCLDFTVRDPQNLSPALYLDGQWDANTTNNVMPLERASR